MTRYYRKIIQIKGKDSPNVRLALAQIARGEKPTHEIIIPGVLTYADYVKRRATWDEVRQCIGLDAEFYEGASLLLYPPLWLNRAEEIAVSLNGTRRVAKSMGIDPAEGGDDTAWTVIDELGILEKITIKTVDTSVIGGQTIALIKKWKLKPEQVLFDAGGGGKQHADYLRRKGYSVRSVVFSESATDPNAPWASRFQRVFKTKEQRAQQVESQHVYKNRRVEMYCVLSQMLDPSFNERGFGIPAEYTELRRQLAPMPKHYDDEGRIFLPPKRKPTPTYKGVTIEDILGCSPDEADSLVLAVFGLVSTKPKRKLRAG